MIKVNTFLGCMNLETGGIVIGWLELVGDVLGFILSVIAIIAVSIYDCADLKERAYGTAQAADVEICSLERGILIIALIIIALICFGFGVIALLCIKGIENRDHVRVKPIMILLAIRSILCFMSILSMKGVVVGLVVGFFNAYKFLVIHSLFTVFQEQHSVGYVNAKV